MPVEFRTLVYLIVLVAGSSLMLRWCLRNEHKDVFRPSIIGFVLVQYAIGLLSPSILIFHLVIILAPVLVARDKADAVCLYFLQLLLLPGLYGPINLGGLYLFSFASSQYATVGLLLAATVRPGPTASIPTPFAVMVGIAFAMFLFITIRGAPITGQLRAAIEVAFNYGIPFVVVSRVLPTADHLRRVMTTLVGAGLILALIAVFEVARSWPMFTVFEQHYGTSYASHMMKMRGGLFRSSGPFPESTSFGLAMAMLLLAAAASMRIHKTWSRGAMVVVAIAAGLVATQGRGDWIGAIVGLLALLSYRGRGRQVTLAVLGLGAAGGVVYLAAQTSHRLAEMLGLRGEAAGTADYRQELLTQGLVQFKTHWLSGQSGPSLTTALQSTLTQGEGIIDFVNSHLYVAMLGGIFAFAIWMLFYAIAPLQLWQYRARARRHPDLLAPAAFAFGTMLALLVAMTFTSTFGLNTNWMFLATAIAAATVRAARRAPVTTGLPARSEMLDEELAGRAGLGQPVRV